MNGRIYDPLLGRFLSADLVVQAPGDLQSYNRYSYVRNNPLTKFDPSGFADATTTTVVILTAPETVPLVIVSAPEIAAAGAVTLGGVGLISDAVSPAAGLRTMGGGGDGPGIFTVNAMISQNMEAARRFGNQPQGANSGQTAAADHANNQAQNQSTAPKPAADKNAPQQNSSGGQMDPNSNGSGGDPEKKTTAPINGTAQKTSPGHAETCQQVAEEMASGGNTESVHLNRSINTVTNGAVPDQRRPDIMSVNKDGTHTVVEVPSKSQTSASQQAKVNSMNNALGPKASPDSRVEPIRPPPPPPPQPTTTIPPTP